jgi:hypothetical protein
VLGFSKGANQTEVADRGRFEDVAFARMRDRLHAILVALDLASSDMDINAAMRAEDDSYAFASLVRCGMSLDRNGKLVTSGTVMPQALRNSWTRAVMDRCIRQHLLDLPGSIQTVVLLGSATAYVEGVMALMATIFPDFRRINDVAFQAARRLWVFATHPSPGNGHFASWLGEQDSGKQGCKRALAVAALRSASTYSQTKTEPAMSTRNAETMPLIADLPKAATTRTGLPSDEVLAKDFHLIDATGSVLIPMRMKNRDTGVVAFRLHRRGAGGNTKENGMREIMDEREAYRLVQSESWGIRTVCKRTGNKGIRYMGVKVREVRWTGAAFPQA